MNKIQTLFGTDKNVLSVYFTAGYPSLNDTGTIIKTLEKYGVGLIEVGMPYSDPIADGETIQKSSAQALANGMTLDLLFDQLTDIKSDVTIPLVFMGYLNQWMQYGIDRFCQRAKDAGISSFIIPDLPLDVYQEEYKNTVEKYGLTMSFLITPDTTEDRIKLAASLSTAFLYVVSQSSITGGSTAFSEEQLAYFKRIQCYALESPSVIGFGVNNAQSYRQACQYANGAIIGSAFIRAMDSNGLEESVRVFVESVLAK